jgi:hypothetical protein
MVNTACLFFHHYIGTARSLSIFLKYWYDKRGFVCARGILSCVAGLFERASDETAKSDPAHDQR